MHDDEKYFTLSNNEISGNDGYYTDNKQTASEDVKYKKKRTYEPKVLAWIAISEDGMLKPYICSMQFANLYNLQIVLCRLQIGKLHMPS